MILLVSVSARMLAELARRDGHAVTALDVFGDLDLRELCPSVSILRDLDGRGGMAELVAAADGIPADGVVYGAGLENMPELVARLARGRTLLGCSPETLRRVRDPAALGASLRAAGFAYPRTFSAEEAPARADSTRRWLRKPVRGGGGRGVRPWRGGRLASRFLVQERIEGLPCSAAAVADGRGAVLLGVSEQLIGRRALGARGFAWCGNVVPPRRPSAERLALGEEARAVCAYLAAALGLRGLFGVDMVWDGRRAWVVEVNPRPTASLEILCKRRDRLRSGGPTPLHGLDPFERRDRLRSGGPTPLHGLDPFTAHLEGCAGRLPAVASPTEPTQAAGKAVVFATRDVQVPDTRGWTARGIRDVPHPGESIAAGHPICTLLATGPSPESVLADLEARAAALYGELHDRVPVHAVA